MKSQLPPPPYSHKGFSLFLKKKNKAFTLAEVLITLTIIGVIAALTVPSLMTKIQDHGFRSAFLKNYALIQNAYAKSISDGAPFWGYGSGIQGGNYHLIDEYRNNTDLLKNYFKIANGPHSDASTSDQMFRYFYLNRTSDELKTSTFKYLNGSYVKNRGLGGVIFQLTDGTVVAFCAQNSVIRFIFIDVNGEKGPNTYGRDIYWLQAAYNPTTNTQTIYPYGEPHTGHVNYTAVGAIYNLASTCKMNSTGDTCAFEIIKNRAYKIPEN